MTATAKRRWSRELDSQVDGIAFGPEGPILLHGYDRPAGGKWIDDVIPGKLGAFDRSTGEQLWLAPCEVGYGRGFGAGIGPSGQVVVLGPSTGGHRMVRMSISNGELIEAAPIAAFDDAVVAERMVVCANARRVWGIDPETFEERWAYAREGERYHHVAVLGDSVFVVVSQPRGGRGASGPYGVLRLDSVHGTVRGWLVAPTLPTVRGIAVTQDSVICVTADLELLLPDEDRPALATAIATHDDEGVTDTLSLVGLAPDAELGTPPRWFRVLETRPIDDLPDVSISADSGKVYVERRAHLEALDAATGRHLGEWTVPGLDEQIAWSVVDGAGLLAEETRVSVFELPA